MASVLTENSNVTCGHQGTVETSSSAKLKVNDSPVLIKNSINQKSVASCTTPEASDTSSVTARPCGNVSAVTTGEAMKLKVSGQPVMLEQIQGSTDGMVAKTTPQTLLSATANQNKLTAI